MPRLKIVLAYDGTNYSGWQIQSSRNKKEPATIQGTMERVLLSLTGQKIVVYGAGRTDSGVHAEGQVCHVDVPDYQIDWERALNAKLPYDIRVLSVESVLSLFHARKSALKKQYAYSLWSGNQLAVPRISSFVWSTKYLNQDLMVKATNHLIGTKDFASFQNSGTEQRTTIRTIYSIKPYLGIVGNLQCPQQWPVCTWVVEGDGFLRQMVRNIMGMLVWCGLGKLNPDEIPKVILAKDRKILKSPSAPAKGLTMLKVFYSE